MLNIKIKISMQKISYFILTAFFVVQFAEISAQINPIRQNRPLNVEKRLIETTDVPQLVKDTQQRMFPNSQVEKWFTAGPRSNDRKEGNIESKGNPNVFIAKFKNSEGFDTYSRITETGDVRGYMTRLEGEKGLPANIKESVNKRFPGFKILNSQKIYHAKTNNSAYRVVLTQNSTRVITFVDEKGNELKEENVDPEIKENILEVPDKQ